MGCFASVQIGGYLERALDVKIQADSVNTGSAFKDDELRSEKFFNTAKDPYITFYSTKIVQTGPHTFEVQGTFTIRSVSKAETLTFVDEPEGKGTPGRSTVPWPSIAGFRHEQRIPFIRIADRVEVTIVFKVTRVSWPALHFA